MKKQYTTTHYQAGLSLLELMISMVIGLFIMAVLITNFVGTKDADRSRNALSIMDADARAAISVLRQTIQHAGYPSIYKMPINKAFFTASDPAVPAVTCRGGAVVRDVATPGNAQRTKDRSRGDVITVITLADNPCKAGNASCPNQVDANPDAEVYVDCLGGGSQRDVRSVACSADPNAGMINPGDGKIFSTFRLGGGNNSRTLYCDGSRGGTQPLVDNVEAMQVLYGVRRSDGTSVYHDATTVDTNNEWGAVASVQVALLMRSSSEVLKKDNPKTHYTLLDKRWTISAADKRRLFRVYTTTIYLPNQIL